MDTPTAPGDDSVPLHRSIMEEQNRTEEEPTDPWTLADAPWVTIALLLVNTALFYAEWRAGQGNIPLVSQQFGTKDNLLIDAGEKWRFITPIFLHGSLSHLLMNSISLLWLGSQMENIFGRRKYFIIYIVAGIVGNIASYYGNPAPSLGASGAIFGLIGAGLVFPIRYRSLLPEESRSRILTQLFLVAAVNLGAGFAIQGVDNYAHMGGLIGGAFATLFLLPDVLDERPRRAWREGTLWVGTVGVLLLMAWAGKAQWMLNRPQPMTTMLVRFSPAAQNPWWTVSVPTRWTLRSDRWTSPDGAELEFTDTTIAPDLRDINNKMEQQPGAMAENIMLNGKPTRRIAFRDKERITEVWQISAYRQRIIFTLKCPVTTYRQSSRDLLAVIATLLIHHAPGAPPDKKTSP